MKNLEKKKQQVLNGEINALDFYCECKELAEILKEVMDEILEDAILEYEKYGSKSINKKGFEISTTQSGRYDYSVSNEWCKLNAATKEIEKKMQAAYNAGGSVINEGTGEIFTPASYKSNKMSLKFKKINYE